MTITQSEEPLLPLSALSSSASDDALNESPDNSDISAALASWLNKLGVVDQPCGDDFDLASNNCVSLCRVFGKVAPTVLGESDFFVPGVTTTNFTRQRRYNTRRLARSIAEWFGVGSRANSPVNGDSTPPSESIGLSGTLPESAKQHVKTITDAARNDGDCIDAPALRLALAELVLFAAVNCENKKQFVEPVLTLTAKEQEALAFSIKRTMSGDESSVIAPPKILAEVRASSENAPPPPLATSGKTAKSNTADLLVPRGIPHVEFKALAEERDTIRKKLVISEAEKCNAIERMENLEREIQAATDRIREVQGKLAEAEKESEQKSNELSEAKAALRDGNQNAEELERLRAKAASVEQLEASLKRASKRLEEVADMRNKLKEVEEENGAFRSNEEHLNKRIELLNSQLKVSNDQVQNLVHASDNLSSELEAKTGEVRDLLSKNQELTSKLETANDHLAQLLTQQPTAEPQSNGAKDRELDHDLITQRLSEEVGVSMSWADIVDCIRGVVEAMHEMDEANRNESTGDTGFPAPVQSGESADFHQNTSDLSSEVSGTAGDSEEPQMLPDFSIVDSKHEAERGDDSDQFDYAVDHPNIREIPAMNRRPSLSTVPEDREGFEDDQDDDVPEPEMYQPTNEGPSAEVQDISGGYPISAKMDVPSGRPAPSTTPNSSMPGLTHSFDTVDDSITMSNGAHHQPMVRQTRSDVPVNALDALRMEREVSSFAALIQQVSEARETADRFKAALAEKERECESLRHDLDSLIKEHDAALIERREASSRDAGILREKERMIALLERTVETKEKELNEAREQASNLREVTEALRTAELQMASETHEHTVKVRAQEIEIARLTAKLEASELIAGKLSAAMDQTNGLTEEIHKERETYLADMTEAARREKLAAEEARADAERAAASHQRAVAEMKQAQAAAAIATRNPSVCCSDSRRHRRSNRISAFWRRVLHLEVNGEGRNMGGTVIGRDARMQPPHPALQATQTGGSSAMTSLDGTSH